MNYKILSGQWYEINGVRHRAAGHLIVLDVPTPGSAVARIEVKRNDKGELMIKTHQAADRTRD